MGQSNSTPTSQDENSYSEVNTDESVGDSEESFTEEDEETRGNDETVEPCSLNEVNIQSPPSNLNQWVEIDSAQGIQDVLLQLENLSTDELKKRMDMASLSRDNILQVSRSHRDDLVAMNDKYANTEISRDFEEKIAVRMLQLSVGLRQVRYKLVPSKIKEGIFWAAIFRLIANASAVPNCDVEKLQSGIAEMPKSNDRTKAAPQDAMLSTSSSISMSDKLDKYEARIHELELALEAAYKILRETKGIAVFEPKGNPHKGKWVVDKNCREFLALDSQVKARLREGKNKRIQEIMNELKFILDSDDEREATGRWDCCGRNEYFGVGCSP